MRKKTVVMEHLGICPCGKNIYVSTSLDDPCVAHDPPICEPFSKMDADEFLTYVRKSRGLPLE